MSDSINIDNLTLHLPAGWQGDPVFLARKVSEQLQNQAQDLVSSKQLNLSLQGHFAGNANRINSQLSDQLRKHKTRKPGGGFND